MPVQCAMPAQPSSLSAEQSAVVKMLLPHLAVVVLDQVVARDGGIVIYAHTPDMAVACPGCGSLTAAVHGRYARTLDDAAISGRTVRIRLRVRQLRCREGGCPVATFAEQVPGLAGAYARRTGRARQLLERIAIALCGRAGARLACWLGIWADRTTMIRILRSLPDPAAPEATKLGVDDFATRRGRTYGTVLIDTETGQVLDLLPDREAGTLAAWLAEHPAVKVICRDRAGAYADAANRGAPQAIQVADRFHLWKNLIEYVEKTVSRHRADLPATAAGPDEPPGLDGQPASGAPGAGPAPRDSARDGRIVIRTRERHTAVHQRLAAGQNHTQIARELGLDRHTVRRFARAADPGELLTASAPAQRPTVLDGHTDYLRQRWDQGCHDAARLAAELKARGYRGSVKTVRRYLQPFRDGITPPTRPASPAVRDVTRWICTRPDRLADDDKARLGEILARSAPLAATAGHVAAFAAMLTGRTGTRAALTEWLNTVDAADLPHLRSFTAGIRRDLDAVINGLTMPDNSGPVEGTVNKIKYLKRQMFGRANFDLLRIRVLHG